MRILAGISGELWPADAYANSRLAVGAVDDRATISNLDMFALANALVSLRRVNRQKNAIAEHGLQAFDGAVLVDEPVTS